MIDVQLRWVVWENAGHKELEFRVKQDTATEYSRWRQVPQVDATHPVVAPTLAKD